MAKLQPPKNDKATAKVVAAIAGVLAIGAGGYYIQQSSKHTGSRNGALLAIDITSSPRPTSASTTTISSFAYKDGMYSADGEYDTPESGETITVLITLKDNIITETSISSTPKTLQSQRYQSQFIAGYKSLVVGKPINQVQLKRVSGSSLTSKGFNASLTKIKNQAKA